ncbi:hypothetical protein [Microbulbifer sp. 2205BS26-8]|uniref:hypothetical protein n=1 Tax=Microbulbifer sp. 2205BS26-8 TaxID=3064386 RepID=UPI00273F64E4|nr:hypothetical protein [Microbulbifer sp. 2205BS26-8]MDP5209833.1 hypothetical protein [Microbulbifer sp. 2205BS26-8]
MFLRFFIATIITIFCFSAKALAESEKYVLIVNKNITIPIKIGPDRTQVNCGSLSATKTVYDVTVCNYYNPEVLYYQGTRPIFAEAWVELFYTGKDVVCDDSVFNKGGLISWYDNDIMLYHYGAAIVPYAMFESKTYLESCETN